MTEDNSWNIFSLWNSGCCGSVAAAAGWEELRRWQRGSQAVTGERREETPGQTRFNNQKHRQEGRKYFCQKSFGLFLFISPLSWDHHIISMTPWLLLWHRVIYWSTALWLGDIFYLVRRVCVCWYSDGVVIHYSIQYLYTTQKYLECCVGVNKYSCIMMQILIMFYVGYFFSMRQSTDL